MTKHKHLTLSDRNDIQLGLERGETFKAIGQLILKDPTTVSMDVRGESKLFFCDPNRSDQKGRIEKNHTLIRDILPKETSFDNLTQEDINLVCSHVNSVKRAALNGKSAYELFAFTYGEEIPKLLGISKIPAEDVCQSSTLLQHKF